MLGIGPSIWFPPLYGATGPENLAVGKSFLFANVADSTDLGDGHFTIVGAAAGDNCATNLAYVGVNTVEYLVYIDVASIAGDSFTVNDLPSGHFGQQSGTGTKGPFSVTADGSSNIFRLIEWAGTLTDIDATVRIYEA